MRVRGTLRESDYHRLCGSGPSPQPSRRKNGEREWLQHSLGNKKAGLAPATFKLSTLPDARAERGSTRAKKKKLRYFFFAFLAFFAFAFFAFFAFLAIVSSQGLMVKRDTRDARRRASLATSSMTNSADSRAPAPCCHISVIALSTAQTHFRVIFARESALARCATAIPRASSLA
ncbi:hypothetical protein AYJ54_17425 [Bradyrhizobium centrolobii]|uniref:Transmembrane protein n=1 Tax=Bradyrhizobium centrolobii TaxID=1505087 RepID=A0A176YMX4_9BRAD|nr:hypothetical protein AYJ54_17425 [Bradyrhizobium centrolobii]